MAAGLIRHGIEVEFFDVSPPAADFAVGWSWRVGERIRSAGFGRPFLTMERGYLGDRFQWTSLGWNGLNGRARFPTAKDSGERFWENFGDLAREWERFDGYALVIGQVEGDMALRGIDYRAWVGRTINTLLAMGMEVRFRPHPEAMRRGIPQAADSEFFIGGTLNEAFERAGCVVTLNSNTGVESVLAGIPTITSDLGAMAWPVTSHGFVDDLIMPCRKNWFRDMAWRQWSIDEIRSGFAWEVVREAM